MCFSVCKLGKKKAPDMQEMYHKMELIRDQGNQNVIKLDKLMKNDAESYKKLGELKKSNQKLDKEIKDLDQRSNMIFSKLDIFNKTDEEILEQIHNLEENDDEMQEEIMKLGKNDQEILKSIKDIISKQEIMSEKLNVLNENDVKIENEMTAMKNNQKEMSDTINKIGNEINEQFKNLTIQDQKIIKQQVQLGLQQNITATKIDFLGEKLLQDKFLIMEEIKKIGFIAAFNADFKIIKFAIEAHSQMNRYSFNMYKPGPSMEEFKKAASLDLDRAITGVFEMIIDGGYLQNSIFKELNHTCDFDSVQYLLSLLHHGINLRKSAYSMNSIKPR